jgi:pimeloyl-ACP methyl ester carboxylesterase
LPDDAPILKMFGHRTGSGGLIRFKALFALLVSSMFWPGAGAWAESGKIAGDRLSSVECWFDAPDGIAARCYRLRVPESRSGRSDIVLELPVAIVSMPATRKRDDPVVYLAGGPGDGAWLDAERIDFWWEFVADNAWVNERDLILLDQRGTGLVMPRMDCSEYEPLQVEALGFGLDRMRSRDAWLKAAADCRARVEREGHDPLSYTSRDSATDLHDLMTALGHTQWNVYGLSYGTRLALTYLRDYPHDFRSVILDSVYLPEGAFIEDDAWRTDRAFRVLFDGCRHDADCAEWYPDLEGRLLRLVEKHNVTPLEREVDLREGGRARVVVTGDMLLNYVFQNLYNRSGIEAAPQIIDIFDRGDEGAVVSEIGYMADQFLDRPDWGDALGLSVDCHEEVPFNDLAKLHADYARYPLLKSFAADDSWGAACAVWPMGPVDPVENAAIFSDVPALLLTGLYDPITPPQYARLAGSRLVNSYYFEFASAGHDVLSNEPCSGELAKLFLDDPTRLPTHECLGELQPPAFRPPAR